MGRGLGSAINQAIRAGEREAKRQRAQQVRGESDAFKAHAALMNAERINLNETEVLRLNADLEQRTLALDHLLAATINVDDFFDLKRLQRRPAHPVFASPKFENPTAPPDPIHTPAEPVYRKPAAWKRLLGKKRYEAAIAKSKSNHSVAVSDWHLNLAEIASLREELQSDFEQAEKQRLSGLEMARETYAKECVQREQEVAKHNSRIDQLISDLSYGSTDAVEIYLSLVLANSKYPEFFPVSHAVKFDPTTAELTARVSVVAPGEMNTIKAYRYVKKYDEIRSTQLSQKAQKDQYASAVDQVALRSIHEIFEADRNGIVKTVSIQIGTEASDPATGLFGFIPLVAVAAERNAFMEFNLSAVVPKNTLKLLGASTSKNPFALLATETSGVRGA